MSHYDQDDNKEYKVGYKNPPQHSQFKKGQSGNPKGRPKCTLDLTAAMKSELNKLVMVVENGKRLPITKHTALAKQIVNQAVAGKLQAIKFVVQFLLDVERPEKESGIQYVVNLCEMDSKL